MDTKIDFEPNPAYGDVKRKLKSSDHIAVNTNVAYETVEKQDLSIENNIYATVNWHYCDYFILCECPETVSVL